MSKKSFLIVDLVLTLLVSLYVLLVTSSEFENGGWKLLWGGLILSYLWIYQIASNAFWLWVLKKNIEFRNGFFLGGLFLPISLFAFSEVINSYPLFFVGAILLLFVYPIANLFFFLFETGETESAEKLFQDSNQYLQKLAGKIEEKVEETKILASENLEKSLEKVSELQKTGLEKLEEIKAQTVNKVSEEISENKLNPDIQQNPKVEVSEKNPEQKENPLDKNVHEVKIKEVTGNMGETNYLKESKNKDRDMEDLSKLSLKIEIDDKPRQIDILEITPEVQATQITPNNPNSQKNIQKTESKKNDFGEQRKFSKELSNFSENSKLDFNKSNYNKNNSSKKSR